MSSHARVGSEKYAHAEAVLVSHQESSNDAAPPIESSAIAQLRATRRELRRPATASPSTTSGHTA